jgi:acyl carrier protein
MISDKFKKVILKELELDDFDFQDSTLANQVPGWDSLRHINIILALEEDYGIRLKSLEVLKCKNLGDFQALIDSKTK